MRQGIAYQKQKGRPNLGRFVNDGQYEDSIRLLLEDRDGSGSENALII